MAAPIDLGVILWGHGAPQSARMGSGCDVGGCWADSSCSYTSWGDPMRFGVSPITLMSIPMGSHCFSEGFYGVGVLMGVVEVTPGANGCPYRSRGVPVGFGVFPIGL